MKTIKVVMLGAAEVGKTCLIYKIAMDTFPELYIPTIFDNYSKIMIREEKQINLDLWDSASMEVYDRF